MATDDDWRVMREAMKLGLDAAQRPAFKPFHYREDTPGIQIRSGKAMDEFIRDDAASAYHPCGSCKMGAGNDEMAVVDSQLRVRGVENLRVIDASVMPSLPSANINDYAGGKRRRYPAWQGTTGFSYTGFLQPLG